MKNPWIVEDPLKPDPARDHKAKIDLKDKDLDADIRPSRSFVMRFRSCAIEVSATDLMTEGGALSLLARCVLAIKEAKAKSLLHVRASSPGNRGDVLPDDRHCARLSCDGAVIEFPSMTIDQGMLVLTRELMLARHDKKLSRVLRDYGITPMLTA